MFYLGDGEVAGIHGLTPSPCYLPSKISIKGLVNVCRVALAQDPFRSRHRELGELSGQTAFVSLATEFLMLASFRLHSALISPRD